jgi:hypothetical protein
MATAFTERRQAERRRFAYPPLARSADGMRVHWGGIWGGVLVTMGVLVILTALGIAVGTSSAVDPVALAAEPIGTGVGLWGAGSLLIALFVGGMVATRIGMVTDKATGVFEGALVWVVSLLVMLVIAGSGIGMVLQGGLDFSDLSAASSAAWTTFAGLLLSLLAAILGAMSGRRRAALRVAREILTIEKEMP